MPSSIPAPRFMVLGKSKFVHVVTTKANDLKAESRGGSGCQQVRKYHVAGKIKPKDKGMSPEAALALDPCPSCGTHDRVKANMTPEQKRAARKAQRDETLKKIADEQKTAGQRKKEAKAKSGRSEREQRDAEDKEVKRLRRQNNRRALTGASKAKSGPRSVGGSDSDKAKALAAFGKEHGWNVEINDGDPGLLVTAVRGAETIRCYFVDGKYDTVRHATLSSGNWTGKLRGVHGCRKQMAGEGRDRPHPEPGKGRSGPRRKHEDEPEPDADESPEDALRRVPFHLDDPDIEIIDAIKGKVIRWRNGQTNSIEEAWLPGQVRPKRAKRDLITITTHPKTERRMVTFLVVASITEDGEQYGPERTVYLDKIVRVLD